MLNYLVWGAGVRVFYLIGVFDGEVAVFAEVTDFYCPGVLTVFAGFLQAEEFCQVIFVERIGLAEIPAWVELVVPDVFCLFSFVEEQYDSMHSGSGEDSAREVEDGVEVGVFKQHLPEFDCIRVA